MHYNSNGWLRPFALLGLSILLAPSSLAQKGGGRAGGKPGNFFPATFDFSPCTNGPCISDDGDPYVGGQEKVRAEFVGAGNPVMDLRDRKSERTIQIVWAECAPVDEGIVPERPQLFWSHVQIVDEDGVLIDGVENPDGLRLDRFLGMAVGQIGFSRMGTQFAAEERKAEGWSIRWNEAYNVDRVQVTRTRQDTWHVTSRYDDGTQAVAAIGRISNGSFRQVGTCPFQVDFEITCSGCPLAP